MEKNIRGITLITVVITIIVLLIVGAVATIGIRTFLGMNENTGETGKQDVKNSVNSNNNFDIEKWLQDENSELALRPPNSFSDSAFRINENNNKNIFVNQINHKVAQNTIAVVSFQYIINENDNIRVQIGTTTDRLNAEVLSNSEDYKKESIANAEIYGKKDSISSDEKDEYYVFKTYNDEKYYIELTAKYSYLSKQYVNEIMDAIVYDTTFDLYAKGSSGIRALNNYGIKTVGEYKFDFSNSGIRVFTWYYFGGIETYGIRFSPTSNVRYEVLTNEGGNFSGVAYSVAIREWNISDGMDKLEAKIEAENKSSKNYKVRDLIKLPIKDYNFYALKGTLVANNEVEFDSTVYLVIDNRVIQFDLDSFDENIPSTITEEATIVDMINKQVINKVLF